MPKLPRLTAPEAEALLLKAGYAMIRASGSHRIYLKEGRRIVIPFHAGKSLHPKIVKQVLKFLEESEQPRRITQRMLKIAITGGAGSGKSVVARMFQELGAAVLDADEVAHAVVAVGAPAWEELKAAFGPEYFLEDGSLNRARMAHLVFADPEARQRLNKIVHPHVAKEIRERLESLERRGKKMVLVEVPLLFEAGLAGGYDRVIVVDAGPREQVQRLQARDHRDEAEIQGIIDAQMPLLDKVARADYVVNNRGSLTETRGQVEKIWQGLQKIILTENGKQGSFSNNLP